jgi:hypothetical protein
MINLTGWRRILFVGMGLVVLVVLILVFFVIPHIKADTSPHATPQAAIHGTLVVAGIHLIFIAAFIYSIMFSFKEGHFENGFLVTAGVMLVLLSLVIIDGAFAYIGEPSMHSSGISMFICVGLDFIAGLLSFAARYFRGHLLLEK